MKKKRLRKYLVSITIACLLIVGMLVPLPYYIEAPGGAYDLQPIVKIKGHNRNFKGAFMLTAVSLFKAQPITYLYAKLNPHYEITAEKNITAGQNMDQYNKVQKFYMDSSIQEAVYTAYRAAGKPVTRSYFGIYVLDVQKNSKFFNRIKIGDVVTAIDGHHFKNSQGFINYIKGQTIGKMTEVSIRRDGKEITVTAPLIKIRDKQPGIGITLTDDVEVKPSVPIEVNAGELGGPSGGLMFSLQIYNQLTNNRLLAGRKIAGTGTINSKGYVGEISGIDKKIIAAKKSGATIFLAPYYKPTKELLKYEPNHMTNYQEAVKAAKKYAPKMKVIPVTTFNEAVKALQTKGISEN